MAKEKLFTPEDFDKNPKTPKKSYIKRIVVAIIVIAAIIVLVLGLNGYGSDNESQNNEELQTTTTAVNDLTVDSTVIEETDVVDVNSSKIDESTPNDVEVTNESQLSKNISEQVTHTPSNTDISSDVKAEALKVIRGDYGNNPERKLNLGNSYQSIQNRVNELKRQGVF